MRTAAGQDHVAVPEENNMFVSGAEARRKGEEQYVILLPYIAGRRTAGEAATARTIVSAEWKRFVSAISTAIVKAEFAASSLH